MRADDEESAFALLHGHPALYSGGKIEHARNFAGRPRITGASVAPWWRSHSLLCFPNGVPLVMAVSVTTSAFGLLPRSQTQGVHAPSATLVESYSCRLRATTIIESYSCKKTGGHPASALVMLRSSAQTRRIRNYKPSSANLKRISTYIIIGLELPPESTLRRKRMCVLPDWPVQL